MNDLINDILACTHCELPLGPKPIVKLHEHNKIVMISQAPGSVAHRSGTAWNDKGGANLRQWLGINDATFFNTNLIGVLPVGFCYPGKGKSGDLPPKKACAPMWHNAVLDSFKEVQLFLLIGKYAQDYYLKGNPYKTLTNTVRNFEDFLPHYFVLPHPSPRNNIWQAKNPWFMKEVVPELKNRVQQIVKAH